MQRPLERDGIQGPSEWAGRPISLGRSGTLQVISELINQLSFDLRNVMKSVVWRNEDVVFF